MSHIKKFTYQEQTIEFDMHGENVMVNATEMANIYGKRVDVFLKSDHAKSYIDALLSTPYGVDKSNFSMEEIVFGKKKGGTWMHRLLALKFAAWLDPKFELWVYSTIDELLFGEFRQLNESLKASAERKNKMEELESKLQESPEYQELERLKLLERQEQYRRSKINKDQLELFR